MAESDLGCCPRCRLPVIDKSPHTCLPPAPPPASNHDVSLTTLKRLTARSLPQLRWRRHGIGVLQGYLFEGAELEARVHIWHPELALAGIQESGNCHNHRFSFRSTVLVGAVKNTRWWLTADPRGDHVLYDFVHARLHTEVNRSSMALVEGSRYLVAKTQEWILTGHTYEFERGHYHDSWCNDLTVTLVEKFDQTDERARVCAPLYKPPVPAFSGDPLSDAEVSRYVAQAVAELSR